jgi:hypothetical protein
MQSIDNWAWPNRIVNRLRILTNGIRESYRLKLPTHLMYKGPLQVSRKKSTT